MNKLILALVAMLIAGPALANTDDLTPWYYDGPTKSREETCTLLLNPTSFDEAKAAEFCYYTVLHWLADTGRVEMSPKTIGDPRNYPNAVCGAQIILRYNDDTPIADALAAEWDTACGEPPAIM